MSETPTQSPPPSGPVRGSLEVSTTPSVMGGQAVNPNKRPAMSLIVTPSNIPSIGRAELVGTWVVFTAVGNKMSMPLKSREEALSIAQEWLGEGKACVIMQVVAQFSD